VREPDCPGAYASRINVTFPGEAYNLFVQMNSYIPWYHSKYLSERLVRADNECEVRALVGVDNDWRLQLSPLCVGLHALDFHLASLSSVF
jgi:hypothetical protein